ncbi:Gfo/Idh/MocA family oxidoreductase [Bifidobacterium sp. MA2]|uniref:Gfo/Idh/MocA family oxidoreductase n=1 Tax=Bifidobacterium santillanense TaxID=2809028 RepID=A0ABS5UQF7_9BIFI|nr:Gfo/Idh/MocA family oxidoreductase [Bifidobacterium santillanense]MBT1173127.1 Gfo/Idh/MocA family oxidoreductase [Bifidobacterium santillanense]
MRELNWATLGCGVIANQLEQALEGTGRKLYSVANRTHAKGVAFAEKYGIGKVYDEIDDVFADPDVDVIYISTPHNTHIGFLRKALAAGKHVLCEKSITLNSDELDEAIALAEANHVLLAEAMTLYHMPLYRELDRIIAGGDGELGRVKLIQMNFGSYKEYDMTNRFFNRNLAGGAMLDIGVYALSCMRWFMSSKPDRIVSQVKAAPTGVDEQAGILLTNPDGQMAAITLSLHAKQPKRGTIVFENGYVEIFDYPRGERATIHDTSGAVVREVEAGDTAHALAYEVGDMEKAIRAFEAGRSGEIPADEADATVEGLLHLGYTRDVMDMMTEIRRDQWHMTYPEEE